MSSLGPQETILDPFGGPWRPFWWSSWAQMHSGGPWRVPEWIFNDFWWILGPPLETILGHFLIFSVIWGVKKHVWIAGMIFDWKISWFVMSQPLKNIANTVVFIGFHVFVVLVILMISGTCLDLIFETFGGLGRQFNWFLVYWRLLEISLIFRVSPEPPQAERRRQVEGKVMVQGVLLQVLYHQFADL